MKRVCHFIRYENGEEWLCFFCPGCQVVHRVMVRKPAGARRKIWAWNASFERPTLIPTVRFEGCSFVMAEGVIEFLAECEHPLAGQRVRMEPL